jgi:hypothetical protein
MKAKMIQFFNYTVKKVDLPNCSEDDGLICIEERQIDFLEDWLNDFWVWADAGFPELK